MRGGQEESNREAQEPLFGGSILCTFVYLFPESELVVSTAVEVTAKWDTGHAMKHEICQCEVDKVDKSPANFMGHPWYRVYDDFAGDDENDMDQPCTFRIYPVGVYVEVGAAVEHIFDGAVLDLLYLQ